METFIKDIRYGIRSLLKRPAFVTTAVITLALGIGANTAIFSVVPVRRGRFFTKFDLPGTTPVVVINETMARRYFGNQDPVGKKLVIMFEPLEPREIVGVISDVLHNGLDSSPRPEMFVHYPQSPTPQMTFMVKTTGDPGSMLPAVKGAIREVNRNQTFSKTATMDQLVGDSLRQRRFTLFLLGSFAAVALALAGIGIYGLMSYSTKQRTHEIGVRMALGAQGRDILRLFIGQGLSLALTGVVIGLAGSLLLTQLMKGLLFGVSASDPATFAMIALLLMVVALLACYVPARRATKVDPLVALRYE
jgi:putative ABC transport system permease protein